MVRTRRTSSIILPVANGLYEIIAMLRITECGISAKYSAKYGLSNIHSNVLANRNSGNYNLPLIA